MIVIHVSNFYNNKKMKKEESKNTITCVNRSITDFLNADYLQFAFSVIEERALPSVIDGFKPAARKIIHAALAGSTKDGKLYKLLALSGDAMRVSLYSHGDASLNGVIVGLCKPFIDNLNPLESDSQVGTIRDPNACGAPRYLYVKHSKYMDLIYKTDIDLTEQIFEEGQYVEPICYYPIIPTVLCKNNQGIAIGYAMHNQSYNPIDVIDACLEALKSKNEVKIFKTTIRPYVKGTKQDNWKCIDGKWFSYGEWKVNKSKDLFTITDLPADVSYEQFEKLLNKLVDSQYMKDWKNLSQDGNIIYECQFFKGQLNKLCKGKNGENVIVNKLKLVKQVPDDLFWLLDENHKLKHFNDKYDVIHYFLNYRLSIYTERKKKLVKILEQKYKENSDLVKFIELVCKGKLKLRNRSKTDIKADMDIYKLPFALISTPMSKVTIEERNELLKQNEEIKKQLEYIKNTSEKQMYIDDLIHLKQSLLKDFQ